MDFETMYEAYDGYQLEPDREEIQRRDDEHLALVEKAEMRGALPPGHTGQHRCFGCDLALGYGVADGVNGQSYHPACAEYAEGQPTMETP